MEPFMSRNALKALAATIHDWHPPAISEDILCGDMPGDKVQIEEGHVEKANTIFQILVPMAAGRAKWESCYCGMWWIRCWQVGNCFLAEPLFPLCRHRLLHSVWRQLSPANSYV